jgi:hypothetical protein
MARSNFPVPAIPPDVILPQIIQECLCEGETCDLALDENFFNANFRGHQIFSRHSLALRKLRKQMPGRAIARAFEVQLKDVQHALAKGDTIANGSGERRALEDDN